MKIIRPLIQRSSFILLVFIMIGCQTYQAVGVAQQEKGFIDLFRDYDFYSKWSELYSEPNVLDDGEKTNQTLIKQLKKDPYGFGFDETGRILRSRGEHVAKELMNELRLAENYYLLALVHILSDIPSRERDSAFRMKLKQELYTPDNDLKLSYAPVMMRALAVNSSKNSINTLLKFVNNPKQDPWIRAETRVALNILGHYEFMRNVSLDYKFSKESTFKASEGSLEIPCDIVKSLLGDELMTMSDEVPNSGTFEILSIKKQRAGITVNGNLPCDKGTWALDIGAKDNERIPVYYRWHTGPKSAAGYVGVLEERQEQWRVVFWKMIWIS